MPATDEMLLAAVELHQNGKPVEAERAYRQVLAADPGLAIAHHNLGALLHSQARTDEALACYQQALAINPDYAQAYCNLGSIFKDRDQTARAVDCYRHALQRDPRLAEAHFNLGVILQSEGQWTEAEDCYRAAIRCKPDYAHAYNNLGVLRRFDGCYGEALDCHETALRQDPKFADAHLNRALLWLLSGDFARGWPEFEWRWRTAAGAAGALAKPRWHGESLDGPILLVPEQGLGDTLQFIRYAPLVKQRTGARVLLQCPRRLQAILKSVAGIDDFVDGDISADSFACHAPLMSLPGIFDSRPEDFAATVPYLAADPKRVAQWRQALIPFDAFNVGISWQGNPDYADDRRRSIPLAQFAPLAACSGVRLFSLQKGVGTEQLPAWSGPAPIIDWSAALDASGNALVDTAALMMSLDLVITSDTAIAHLAGALGRPVWVALPLVPDWRWMLARNDSPWYPTMRLFRQQSPNDWEGVFARMTVELRALSSPTTLS